MNVGKVSILTTNTQYACKPKRRNETTFKGGSIENKGLLAGAGLSLLFACAVNCVSAIPGFNDDVFKKFGCVVASLGGTAVLCSLGHFIGKHVNKVAK